MILFFFFFKILNLMLQEDEGGGNDTGEPGRAFQERGGTGKWIFVMMVMMRRMSIGMSIIVMIMTIMARC